MNILPKKRWHVRTKENIARVRKDEAEAAEKERLEKLRIDAADREARLSILKHRSKEKLSEYQVEPVSNEEPEQPKHIDLFTDLEHAIQTTNKDHDKEVKDKKEEYEKKIGYLTYLGQDTNEALGKKNWYELPPQTSRFSRPDNVKDTYDKLVLKDEDGKPKKRKLDSKNGEIAWKAKQYLDPLNSLNIASKTKMKGQDKDSQSDKNISSNKEPHMSKRKIETKKSLEQLREARLKREQAEKIKAQMFLNKISGISPNTNKEDEPTQIVPKYNSQFNPELARQNHR